MTDALIPDITPETAPTPAPTPALPEHLGDRLAALRIQADLSVAALAELSRVQKKYILALEAENFGDLPDPMYVRHFLKALAQALGVDSAILLSRYQPAQDDAARPQLSPSAPSRFAFIVPSRLIGQIAVGALVCVIAVVLLLQVRAIFTPPDLSVDTPTEGLSLPAPVTLVSGATARGSSLTINGERVIPDPQGKFSVEIDLHQGLNLIKIAAKKPHSSERIVYRQVFVEGTAATSTPSGP